MEKEIPIDRVARERAEGWIGELAEKVSEVELLLASLGGFVPDESLPRAAVASAGRHGEAIREQLPILRQAIRDMPLIGAPA